MKQPQECESGVCEGGECQEPSCEDGVKNGEETDVDCGGPECAGCEVGQICEENEDCASDACSGGECVECIEGQECESGVCEGGECQEPTCEDEVKNGEETDVDCGGPECAGCEVGQSCELDTDCESGVCEGGECQEPTCEDEVKNGEETDVDCGGSECAGCEAGDSCELDRDCESDACFGGECVECTEEGDCAADETCDNNQCVCAEECCEDADCTTAGEECQSNQCVCTAECCTHEDCTDEEAPYCDASVPECVECTDDSHCGDPRLYECNTDNQCVELCDTSGGPFGYGSGSENDPYLICASHHLAEVGTKQEYLDDHFVVTTSLEMSGVLFPRIGDDSAPFVGSFDGNEQEIQDLGVSVSNAQGGMFGAVGGEGLVENVVLSSPVIDGGSRTGGIAGRNEGNVENCHVFGGTINGSSQANIGGVVGWNDGTIEDSSSTGSVTGYANTGGLVGTNTGDITRSSSGAEVDINDTQYGGGLVGQNDGGQVRKSASYGTVKGGSGVGGLVGYNRDGRVVNSYSTAVVEGEDDVGGLVGLNWRPGGSTDFRIIYSYSSGEVRGIELQPEPDKIGGFIGDDQAKNSRVCYWDTVTSDQEEATGDDGDDDEITGLETDQFDDTANFFENWDFEDTWELGIAPDGQCRPVLQWQNAPACGEGGEE